MTNDNRKPAVLIDIDGVLCQVPYEVGPLKFSWDEFMEADLKRAPIEAGIGLARMLIAQGLYPVFLTARPESMRFQTEQMLAEYGFHGMCYMASNEATKAGGGENYQLYQMMEKARVILKNRLMEEFDFLFAIDDQELNVKLFKELGIPTIKAMFI
jgi:hypothetical protein